MTTGDTHIGSHSQHRLPDQVSANPHHHYLLLKGAMWLSLVPAKALGQPVFEPDQRTRPALATMRHPTAFRDLAPHRHLAAAQLLGDPSDTHPGDFNCSIAVTSSGVFIWRLTRHRYLRSSISATVARAVLISSNS